MRSKRSSGRNRKKMTPEQACHALLRRRGSDATREDGGVGGAGTAAVPPLIDFGGSGGDDDDDIKIDGDLFTSKRAWEELLDAVKRAPRKPTVLVFNDNGREPGLERVRVWGRRVRATRAVAPKQLPAHVSRDDGLLWTSI